MVYVKVDESEDTTYWPKASEMLPLWYISFLRYEVAMGEQDNALFVGRQLPIVVET